MNSGGLGAWQPGSQWTPELVERAADVNRVVIPYQYVITHSAVAAATVDEQNNAVQISQWPFLWTTLHVGDSSGDDPADVGFSFSLQDEGRGQYFMNARIMSRFLMSEGPIVLPAPWLFGVGASIRSVVENFDQGTARDCYVTLGGWLVQPEIVGEWDRYGVRNLLRSPFGYPLPGDSGLAPVPFFWNVTSASIAASGNATQDPAFSVGTREYDWVMLSACAEAGTSGMRLAITDNRTRQGFSTNRIPSITLLEHGPVVLPTPWRIGQGGSMQTTMENLDTGTARILRATFGGVLL